KLGKRTLDARQIIAQRRQVELVAELASAPKQKWDPLLVEQAIGNLLDNAIDFSPANGQVTLSGSQQEEGYCFRVTDCGPGIPDYALPRIFERFYSLPRPDKGKSSGLGLSFAHEVAHQHGGRLTLSTRPEGGALAELWLPFT
ncbi:MAG: beta-lactam sensor histidine kinase BlrB, partial [Aeromonas veronii]